MRLQKLSGLLFWMGLCLLRHWTLGRELKRLAGVGVIECTMGWDPGPYIAWRQRMRGTYDSARRAQVAKTLTYTRVYVTPGATPYITQ